MGLGSLNLFKQPELKPALLLLKIILVSHPVRDGGLGWIQRKRGKVCVCVHVCVCVIEIKKRVFCFWLAVLCADGIKQHCTCAYGAWVLLSRWKSSLVDNNNLPPTIDISNKKVVFFLVARGNLLCHLFALVWEIYLGGKGR